MSLKTGILTLIGESGEERELKTVGKIFRIGSYLSCDLVLDNPEARNVHCEIQSDSFGRITITNHSKSNPVRINGVPLKGTRPLYTGSVISIFENTLKWVNKHRLPRNIVDMEKNQTPKIGFKRTDQAPNSEPSAPMRRKNAQKRLTMHNFGTGNRLVDEDDVDTFRDGNDENKRQDRLTRASIISAAKSFGATPPRSACRSKILSRRTFEAKSLDEGDAYKENKMIDTPEMKKLTLLKCQSSAMVVTSYSPNATPKKKPSSFACVVSNKNTPKSTYGTPRSVFSELNASECAKSACSTPKTPADICTMHLIDLTSPDVYKTPLQKRTPLFRSALKNSTAKSVSKVAIKDDPDSTIKSCTPSSNKKLRWNTSDVIKAEKVLTPGHIALNKSTPYRKSSITPNKLRQSLACRSTGKKLHDCLSKSITETPPSLTRQRTLTAGSAKSTHSSSKLTPILKRKSLNISLPLKTPKEIFSDGKSTTPKHPRLSLMRTPNNFKSVQNKEVSVKKTQARPSVSTLDRSKTFIVDSPSISQKSVSKIISNKTKEHVEEESPANDTFTCDDDFEMKVEDNSRKTPSHGESSVSRTEKDINKNLGPILDEETNQSNPISSNGNVSILSNKSDNNLHVNKAYEDDVDLLKERQVEDDIESISEEDEISFEHQKRLNNISNLSASNRTFDKSNRSLNNTFDKTETEHSGRKSLRRRSQKENEAETNISYTNDTNNFSRNWDFPCEKKSEEKSRKSTRYSRNIQLTPCRDQIEPANKTATTPSDTSHPLSEDIVSSQKERLEKQLELSLSEGQSPGKCLDHKGEIPVEEALETVTEQENISSEDEEVLTNPTNMTISNSTLNKSNRSLNNTFGENEAETSSRKSLRRQILEDDDPEKSNINKFNLSANLNSTEEEIIGVKNRKSTRISQTSMNIETTSCRNSPQIEKLGEKSRKSLRSSEISANTEPISWKDSPQEEKLGVKSRKSVNISDTNTNTGSVSWQDSPQDEKFESQSRKSMRLSQISTKIESNSFQNSPQEKKLEAHSRKSMRLSQTSTNTESLSRPNSPLVEKLATQGRKSMRLSQASKNIDQQLQLNIKSSETLPPSNISTKSITSPFSVTGESIENACNASENDLNFMFETPVKGLSETISEDEETFPKLHDVSNRSLNQTFDKAERSGNHDTSRRSSLRRRSEKEPVEPERDNVHAADKITSTVLYENKSDENRRKSARLSRTSTNIESISPQEQTDEILSAGAYSVTGNDENSKQSAEMIHKSPKLIGIKEMMKTPKISKDIDFTGVKELVRGRKSTVGLKNVVGVKELFKTPKTGGLINLVGVKELIKTPKPDQGLSGPKGMKELFNTPTRDDLTDVFGVKELMNTPKPCTGLDDPKGMKEMFNTPTRDDLTDVYGVKELVNTPKPNVGLTDLKGMKELFNTPTRDDLTDVFGVKELVNTPQPERGLEDPKGVKELFNTPARDDLTDVFGVKELVNTPKPEVGFEDGKGVKELFKTPKDNPGFVDTRGVKELFKTPVAEHGLDDGKGVKELFKTPRSTPGIRDARGIKELFNTPAQNNISDVRGVRELMKTPIEKSPNLSGMHELMKTPYVSSYEDNEGLNDVFKTPASRGVMVLSTPKSIAVEKLSTSTSNLLKTPKELNILEDIEEVEEIFKTPVSNLMNSELQDDGSLHVSPEESFDRLIGKSSARRTYGRKSATPRILPIPIASESPEGSAKTDIQEWVDNVVTSPKVGIESKATEEIILNSPVVKLHRKPLATSSSIKPTNHRRSSRFSNALLKEGDLNEVSGIEQLEDSFLSSSEISGVLVEKDETSKEIIVDTLTASPEKRKRISNPKKDSIITKTPQKSVQFVDSSHHAIKVTPQIRRLRNRVSTPYTKKGLPPDSTNDPFADLSIQYIDESSLKISDSKEKSNNTSLYKIRRSRRTNDISLELIESKENSTKRSSIHNTINTSTIGAEVEFISTLENSKNGSSVMKKGRKSRKTITESGCVISISDDEIVNGISHSKEGKSLLESASKTQKSGLIEFVATNELSVVSDHNQIQSVDAFQSINNVSENITLIDVGASMDDTKEVSLDDVSENVSDECSTSLVESVSYEEEEEKLLNLYDTRLSDTTKGQTLEIVYVDSNSKIDKTNISVDAGGINLDDISSVSIKSTRKSLRKSITSVNGESCVEQIMDGNTKNKSPKLSIIALSEGNSSIQMDNTNVSVDAGGINLAETSSVSIKPTRKSLRKSIMSVNEESCVEQTMHGNTTQKSPKLSVVALSEGNSSIQMDNTNISVDAGSINLAETSSVSIKSTRKSLRKSIMSVNEESCVEQTMNGNTTQKSPKLSVIALSEGNSSIQKIIEHNQTTSSLGSESVEQVQQDNSKNMSNEFENFVDDLEVKKRFVGTPLTPKANKSEQADKTKRKTMGDIASLEPIDIEAEKMQLEFANFTTNPKVMMTRANSQSELRTPRLTVSRRTTGKLPLNPYFDVEAEKERRNLSIEFENFNSSNTRRSLRGRSLSPLKCPKNVKERRTVGQKPLRDESFDYEYELERRNMSLEFSQFEAVPRKNKLRSRSITSNIEKTDSKQSKNRLTMGQVSKNKFDYKSEVDRRNMSLEFENFNPDAPIALKSKRLTLGMNKALASKNFSRLSEGQNIAKTNFNLHAEKERRKLSLEFQNFDENPFTKSRSRGHSEIFNSISASPSARNHRKTFGEKPSNDDFDMEREVENYNLQRNFESNQARNPRSHSKSPVKDSEKEDNNVDEVAARKMSHSQNISFNVVELPEGKNESLSESNHVNDSLTKVTLKTSKNQGVELEADAKGRHVRFGENVYYEISLLESYDSNESQNKNSRGRKKPKQILENEKSTPKSRSRRNKTDEDDGFTEGISEHTADKFNPIKQNDKNEETVTSRRGKRNRTVVQQTEEKHKEVNSLGTAEPSDHNDEEISASSRAATDLLVPEEDRRSLKSSSNEPLKPRRGQKTPAKNRKEVLSESVDDNSKGEEIVSKIAAPEKEIAVVKSDVKDENEENNTKTRSRRGRQAGSNKRAKQKEDKTNIKDQNMLTGSSSNDADTNTAEHQGQEIHRVDTVQENVSNVNDVPKTRNRRLKTNKNVESQKPAPEVDNSNEGTLPGNAITVTDNGMESTSVTIDMKVIQQTKDLPEPETITKINDNLVEHKEIEKDGKDNIIEERNENKSSRKIGRVKKAAQTNEEGNPSPHTRGPLNVENTAYKKDELKTVEIPQADKTENNDQMNSSSKTPIIESDVKELESNEHSVKKQRTRNTRQKTNVGISNSSREPSSKRSQRLVSIDVENEKNSDDSQTGTSSAVIGVAQSETITKNESESRRRNLRRKPLLETDSLNAESPADILPAKRTRRLASNVESTSNEAKTRGRSTRAKEDKENIEILPEAVVNDAEALRVPNEIINADDTPLRPESPADILPAKRTRRLASNVESTTSDSKTRGRSTRAKENKDNIEIMPEKIANDAEGFKIPNEIIQADDTPLRPEYSEETTSVDHTLHPEPIKAKRTRRLVSVDEQSINDLKDTDTPNSLSSTNVPTKRTRRLPSNQKTTVNNPRPKQRAGRGKTKVEGEVDIDIIVESVTDDDEVFQSTDEVVHKNTENQSKRGSDTIVKNSPEEKDSTVTQVQDSKPVVGRRNRKLVSVDVEPTERRPASRTARTRGKKEEKEDSQSSPADESKEHGSIDEKTERDEIVFKTPNEVKPKRRGARLRSETDTPNKDSAEIASIAPARRTRRLVSVETNPHNIPEISAKLTLDEQTISTYRPEPENKHEISAKHNEENAVVESQEKIKPKRGRKAAAKSQPRTPEIEHDKNDNPEELTSQRNEQNDPEITPKESTSKAKRGRTAKRKVETVEVNTDEVVTRTRSRRK